MKSVPPFLMPVLNRLTSKEPYFFIIYQNDVDTFGRNELPYKTKIKLKKFIYSEKIKMK